MTHKRDNEALCQLAYIMLMVTLKCILQCPCKRVHQKEQHSVGIIPESTTQPRLGYLDNKDTTSCLLTLSCRLHTAVPSKMIFPISFHP